MSGGTASLAQWRERQDAAQSLADTLDSPAKPRSAKGPCRAGSVPFNTEKRRTQRNAGRKTTCRAFYSDKCPAQLCVPMRPPLLCVERQAFRPAGDFRTSDLSPAWGAPFFTSPAAKELDRPDSHLHTPRTLRPAPAGWLEAHSQPMPGRSPTCIRIPAFAFATPHRRPCFIAGKSRPRL